MRTGEMIRTCSVHFSASDTKWRNSDQGKYMPKIMVDGWFKARHMKMRNAWDDVALDDGHTFTVTTEPYKDHLNAAHQRNQVSVVANKLICRWLTSDGLRRSEHVTVMMPQKVQIKVVETWSRPGLQQSVVFTAVLSLIQLLTFRRESSKCTNRFSDVPVSQLTQRRQRNIDWAISEALRHYMEKRDLRTALLLYDIVCKYHVYLRERIKKHGTGALYLPDEAVQLLYGIGLFHVHGHRESCFARFAPVYIPGAGMLDGELIETLWALLKGMIGTTRGMTTSHRKEVLDDHMNDINWVKTTRQGASILSESYIV